MKTQRIIFSVLLIVFSCLFSYSQSNQEETESPETNYISSFSDSKRKNYYPVRERMLTKSLNGTWKFKLLEGLEVPSEFSQWTSSAYNDSNWDNIVVPGNWETQGFKRPEYRHIGEFTGLYRTTFKYDKFWKNKRVILRFDGVHNGYECFINGNKVGEWGSAFNLYQMDITDHLKTDGLNTLSLKVSTRSMGWEFDKNDCWVIAGITRCVELFPLDNEYIEDITFVSEVDKKLDAEVKINVDINRFRNDGKSYRLNVALSDPLNNHVLDFTAPIDPATKTYEFNGLLNQPKLWTAETPNLYRLEVFITNENGYVIQRANENVGIRSMSVEGFDLKVNHKPILLRGVCINEIDPKLGRALTYKERRNQLELIKKANINFIRTAHYPFGPDFLKLCDEMGFYVADEVPFGHGDQFLKDKSYLPELLERAESTLRRDKNHPSVIIWTLGNENPYTSMVEEVIKYVKEKDPTRPRGLPQRAPTFASQLGRHSKNVDILMGHYLNDTRIQQLIEKADRPVIMTEYAHSLGLAFGDLEDKFNRILTEPKIIGGAIWAWQDQAILTDGSTTDQNENQLGEMDGALSLPNTSKVTQGVWIDSVRYMDTFGDQGTDGVVYADGYPQEDFYLVRKVYSPVVVLSQELSADKNKKNYFEIEIENRFDFITLNGYKMVWKLVNVNKIIQSGENWLSTAPQTNEKISISADIPQTIDYNDLVVNVEIQDYSGKAVYEKNIPVKVDGKLPDLKSEIENISNFPKSKLQASRNGISFSSGNLKFSFNNKGILSIFDGNQKVIESPLFLRTGRKETVTLEYQGLKSKFYWDPYILSPIISKIETNKNKDAVEAVLTCKWFRNDDKEQFIDGKIFVKFTEKGLIKIDYELNPSDKSSGNFLELGLTLKMDPKFDTFRWLGDGPFSSTPGKTAFNERKVWKLHKNDIRFNGNRGNVDLAVINSNETGIGLSSENGNIGIKNIEGAVFISQNIFALSYGNKFSEPKGRIEVGKLENQKGSLMLFIDNPARPNNILENIFKPYSTVVPEQPYLDSYGW